MVDEIQNFWVNQIELKKRIVKENKRSFIIPSIYNTQDDRDIENLCDLINRDFQI